MKFALIGIGRWGQTYIKTIKQLPNSTLVATCSRTAESYNQLPSELKIAPNVSGPNAINILLSKYDIDTVIIASHPDSHFNLSRSALWYRKNVICEKPCMFNDNEYRIIEDLIENEVFYVDYTNLFHNVVRDMVDLVKECHPYYKLRLVNSGNGPIRNYSDWWDYGAHVASVIYYLFPNEYFYNVSRSLNEEGNHVLKMKNSFVEVEAVFGNKSEKRQHSFELSAGPKVIFWENDKSENPLLSMLKKFETNSIISNITLSRRITSLLKRSLRFLALNCLS